MSTATATLLDPNAFEGELLQALAVLFNQKQTDETVWLRTGDVSTRLRDEYGIGLHALRIRNVFMANRHSIARRKRASHWEFSILKAGEELLGAAQSSILFIDPTQAVKATRSLHDFLSSLKGTIRVCDAYLDNTTLEHLQALDKVAAVRVLTKNVKDSGPLRRLVAAWKNEGRNLEIRVATSAPLHDRYIVDDAAMMILGTSFNGFGKKQCFVIQAGPDIRAVLMPVFDGLWASATIWP